MALSVEPPVNMVSTLSSDSPPKQDDAKEGTQDANSMFAEAVDGIGKEHDRCSLILDESRNEG